MLRLNRLLSACTRPYPPRTHSCAQLNADLDGAQVTLAGWLLPERKGKTVSFFPLKDSHGTTQLVVNHADAPEAAAALSSLPPESTVLIQGTVALRPQTARRPGPTGDIDVNVSKVTLLNPATEMPFLPSSVHNLPNEDLRARYRFLDLRRSILTDNIKKRGQVAFLVRSVLHDQGFTEVETPVLLRSSPEGAREFLVPTRQLSASEFDSGSQEPLFYALQQSPQQPKQLLICSGAVDKYYQIARCFRDEDGRKDRQPEFTQIDLEMAFVSWGESLEADPPQQEGLYPQGWRIGGTEVRQVIEDLVRKIWRKVEGIELPKHFKVMTYYEAMSRFGSDKPDTRFGLEIINLSDRLSGTVHNASSSAGDEEVLECIVVRKSFESEFIHASRTLEQEHAEHITLTKSNLDTWLLKSKTARAVLADPNSSFSDFDLEGDSSTPEAIINESLRLHPGDHIFLAQRPRLPKGGSTALGKVRLGIFEQAQARGEYTVTEAPHFLWVTEFPLFTRDDSDKDFLAHGRWSSSHHPFTAPMWQDVEPLQRGDIEHVRGQHYDLVLNGVEIGGGSVRIHDADMQDYIFSKVLQLSDAEKAPFNHLLQALRSGAPPHGGIALGFDRLMSILCKTQSIRDVIAFPKTSGGTDLMFKSPAAVDAGTLKQYGIGAISVATARDSKSANGQ
ncbi:aspartyl-tRNA synthetase [Ephemerocybe angulata]|uniref:Aspartyl-tRNA synthetase n=1 Tax=Ephemerocybe angulata TaxID=980116 RepID=A0A8H6MB74_9AGAR|nr:aspartyl-tRNA synthetase [Tulosesus angulatus]